MVRQSVWICVLIVATTYLQRAGAEASDYYYKNISYKEINKSIKERFYDFLNPLYGKDVDCDKPYGTKVNSQYNCGEIPLGTVLSNNQKRLMTFKVNKGKIQNISNGAVYLDRDLNFEVLLSRKQTGADVEMPLIDVDKIGSARVTRFLGRSVFVRHVPAGQSLFSLMCLYVPGASIRIPNQNVSISGYQKKKFLLWSYTGKFSATAQIKTGSFKYEQVRICGLFKTEMAGTNIDHLKPKTELVKLSLPKIEELSRSGFAVGRANVKLKGFLTNLFSSIYGFFTGKSLPEMIRVQVEKGIHRQLQGKLKITSQSFKSGKWIKDYVAGGLQGAPFTKNIMKALKAGIKSSVQSPIRLTKKVERLCYDSFSDFSVSNNIVLNERAVKSVCEDLAVNVSIEPFFKDREFSQKGCYRNFYALFNVHRSHSEIDWQSKCSLVSRIQVEGGRHLSNSRDCLVNSFLNEGVDRNVISKCQSDLIEDLTQLPVQTVISAIRSAYPVKYLQEEFGLSLGNAQRVADILGLIK
ncbi:MAG: hypothetical protein KDD61_08220 [Bdellovibrionales bacterium]|nr:hypothetical protein [Bdellovibrionales bacterium]